MDEDEVDELEWDVEVLKFGIDVRWMQMQECGWRRVEETGEAGKAAEGKKCFMGGKGLAG
jgi:hypothetical protein